MTSINKNLRIIFDFDSTLFDTESVKETLYKISALHGYGKEEAKDIYLEARVAAKKIIINMASYLSVLEARLRRDGKKLRSEEVSVIMEGMWNKNYLLPGAKYILGLCKQREYNLYVLSLGVKEWQEEKVEHSGILSYMPKKNVIFTDSLDAGKTAKLHDLFGKDFDGSNCVLFNDKPDETGGILATFPKLVAFVRQEERDIRYSDRDFKALEQSFPGRVYIAKELLVLKKYFEKQYG